MMGNRTATISIVTRWCESTQVKIYMKQLGMQVKQGKESWLTQRNGEKKTALHWDKVT